ncbi:MAG: hypothetical protein ABI865_15615, partial [Nitrosospira sp.]
DAGLGVYVHDFKRGQFDDASAIKFTFYWHSTKRWEGSDFSIEVDKISPHFKPVTWRITEAISR